MQTKRLCVCLNTYSTDSEAQSIDYLYIYAGTENQMHQEKKEEIPMFSASIFQPL